MDGRVFLLFTKTGTYIRFGISTPGGPALLGENRLNRAQPFISFCRKERQNYQDSPIPVAELLVGDWVQV